MSEIGFEGFGVFGNDFNEFMMTGKLTNQLGAPSADCFRLRIKELENQLHAEGQISKGLRLNNKQLQNKNDQLRLGNNGEWARLTSERDLLIVQRNLAQQNVKELENNRCHVKRVYEACVSDLDIALEM